MSESITTCCVLMLVVLLIVLFSGTPDIHDGLIAMANKGVCK